jgi:L-alanine-DL-glutamate epimerase-like enolase superfamily enzyme
VTYDLSYSARSLHYKEAFRENLQLNERKSFIVRLDDDVTTGLGEATPLGDRTESSEETEQKLDELVLESPFDSGELDNLLTGLNAFPATRHGISQARYDLLEKNNSKSISDFFGSRTDDKNRVMVNDLIPVQCTIENLVNSMKSDYEVIKVKCTSLESNVLDTIASFSEDHRVGSGFRIDFNEKIPVEAQETLVSRVKSIPLDYLEQPFKRENLDAHQKLRESDVPVALDESLTEYSIDEIATHEAADAIVIKPMTAGGIDRASDIIIECMKNELEPILTTSMEGPVGRAGTIQLALAYSEVLGACGLMTGKFIKEDSNWESEYFDRGYLSPPQTPGNAIPDHVRRKL